jgi:hypothetical protein
MSKITRSARMQPCTMRLFGCRNEIETTVFAHAPSIYKGTGIKSPDWWGCFSCHRCHSILDGRETAEHDSDWLRAIFETQQILYDKGLLSMVQ